MSKKSLVSVSVFLICCLAGSVYASDTIMIGGARVSQDALASISQEAKAAGAIGSNEFGVEDLAILNLGPCEMLPRGADDFTRVDNANCQNVGVLSGQNFLFIGAEVHLPNGALVTEMTIFYRDTHTTSNISSGLWRTSTTGVNTGIQFLDPTAAFSAGDTSFTATLTTPHTIDNTTNKYHFLVALTRDLADPAQEERLYRVVLKYRRQISPAPAIATFTDVPIGHLFFQHIEALVASGITVGIGGGLYGPDQAVTRGQMAAFLARALGLHWPN